MVFLFVSNITLDEIHGIIYSQNELNNGYLTTIQLVIILGYLIYRKTFTHSDFSAFIGDSDYICGHNVIHHDLVYLNSALSGTVSAVAIDTLYLSPLLFPRHPYHALLKDDKLLTEELNNPVNDSKKASKLFYDEVNAFNTLPPFLKQIYFFF